LVQSETVCQSTWVLAEADSEAAVLAVRWTLAAADDAAYSQLPEAEILSSRSLPVQQYRPPPTRHAHTSHR